MFAELGPFALIGGYCFAGLGVLAALQLVHLDVRGIAAALGLAFMVGVAVVLVAGIELLCVGASVGLVTLGALAALIGGGGFAVAWRRGGEPRASRGSASPLSWTRVRSWTTARSFIGAALAASKVGVDRWVAAAVVVALAVFAVLTFRWARVQPLQEWDAWSIWARKGTLLLDYGHLPAAFFTSRVYAFMHPDYPLLVPLYESTWFRAVGSANTQNLHVWFWILFVAFLWATAYVASRVVRPAVWAPLVGLLAVTPAIWGQLMTMYADVPMGLFLMVGVLSLGLWITGRRRRDLALAVILLAAAASTKNEGLTAAVSVLAAAFIVTLVAQGRSWRRSLSPLIVAVLTFAVLVIPWRVWLAAHHIVSEMPVGRGLEPSYLLARADRIQPTVNALFSEVTDQNSWCYLLPIGIALLIAGLATRGLRDVAAFYGLATWGAAATILWAYVISPSQLSWLIPTSANRTVVGPMLIAVAGTLHLAGALTGDLKRTSPHPRGAHTRLVRRMRSRRARSASSS